MSSQPYPAENESSIYDHEISKEEPEEEQGVQSSGRASMTTRQPGLCLETGPGAEQEL